MVEFVSRNPEKNIENQHNLLLFQVIWIRDRPSAIVIQSSVGVTIAVIEFEFRRVT